MPFFYDQNGYCVSYQRFPWKEIQKRFECLGSIRDLSLANILDYYTDVSDQFKPRIDLEWMSRNLDKLKFVNETSTEPNPGCRIL